MGTKGTDVLGSISTKRVSVSAPEHFGKLVLQPVLPLVTIVRIVLLSSSPEEVVDLEVVVDGCLEPVPSFVVVCAVSFFVVLTSQEEEVHEGFLPQILVSDAIAMHKVYKPVVSSERILLVPEDVKVVLVFTRVVVLKVRQVCKKDG